MPRAEGHELTRSKTNALECMCSARLGLLIFMACTSNLLAADCLLPARRQQLTWPWEPQAAADTSHQSCTPRFCHFIDAEQGSA